MRAEVTKSLLVVASVAAVVGCALTARPGAIEALGQPRDSSLPPVPVPPENPLTEEKRILGKILFWDEQLSSNDTVACGTCHMPYAGGADARSGLHPGADGIFGNVDDVVGSLGVIAMDASGAPEAHATFGLGVQVTNRSAQTNIGVMYAPELFWDGRASSSFVDPESDELVIASGGALESQAVQPIMNAAEMARKARTWADVRNKLQSVSPLALASDYPADIQRALAGTADYPALFAAAFGDDTINAARIAMALATYQRTLIPDRTPWDRYIAGDNGAMTPQQVAGWEKFQSNFCTECHVPPLFTDNQFYNVGLRPASEDMGRQSANGNDADRGKFKTPTLRNVGLRKHLGHVGWLSDTMDFIGFYNAGSTPGASRHEQFYADQSQTPVSNRPYSVIQVEPFFPDGQEEVSAFLNGGLTDPRVAAETYPFDRPTLRSEVE